MGETGKTSSSKMPAMILAIVGIILVLTGVAIATIHSHLRGSGLGTVSLVIGIVLLVIGVYRFTSK
jgi:uncharacterized membrane protein